MTDQRDHTGQPACPSLTRRHFLGLGSAAVLGGAAAVYGYKKRRPPESPSQTFIATARDYGEALDQRILDGLTELGIDRKFVQNKRIVLKPNLVETAPGQSHINTHPAVVVAAAEAFRRLDAGEVIVAEGQGHRRDSMIVLDESGMGEALLEAGLPFVDLNHEEFDTIPNKGRHTGLANFHVPKTILEADLLVSIPKMKTHHWVGMTGAMKNLFGVMPGIVYGWPKNVLHHQGIHESIVDINSTVRSAISIVDGIVGMEGDGPIMGEPKNVGCVIVGSNPVAVDATCARIMALEPSRIDYLKQACGYIGPVSERRIAQRGETINSVTTPFQMLDFPHLQSLRRT